MDSLFQIMELRLQHTPMKIIRGMMTHINWNARMISIRGSRGVGKSTIMLQYIKMHYPPATRTALYCSLDGFYFNNHTILQLAEKFHLYGGRHLFLDEVHKYPNWERELKEIYDSYPDMRVVLSGSSILHLIKGDADLSRRYLPYYMPGLSLREYLQFYKDIQLPSYSLSELLEDAPAISSIIRDNCSPVREFNDYLKEGYYPFFNGNKDEYYLTIENVVNFIVEQELPMLSSLKPGYARKIKALLGILATSKPFEVDITKMSKMLELSRETVLAYLELLSKADLLKLLYSDLTSVKKMQKPDKIYLANTNLLTALSEKQQDEGNIRETFVVSQLMPMHTVEYGKEAGDFLIEGKWRMEVGGANKGFSQIANIPDSYVFADDIEFPSGHKLPLWLLGFLY